MTVAFDPRALPPALRARVERALAEGEGHEQAIEAIEAHLAAGGDRTPDLLVALATLTYDDAASALLHQLGQASERALDLIEEAALARGTPEGLERLRDAFEAARDRERAREARLRTLLLAPERAAPTDLAELAHRVLLAGDDRAARALMREAARLDEDAEADVDEARAG